MKKILTSRSLAHRHMLAVILSSATLIGQNAEGQVGGLLDSDFSADGIAIFPSSGIDGGNALAIQADDKIIATGSNTENGVTRLYVTRHLDDGDMDQAFGTSGRYTHLDGSIGHDILVRPNGDILVAGERTSNSDFLLVCLTADGSPKPSFQGGWVSIDFGQTSATAYTIATDLDQRIYVAGGASGDFAIARFFMDGTLDMAFSNDGGTTTDFSGTSDVIIDIAVLTDGSILAAGYTTNSDGYRVSALAKYDFTGELDTQFGTNGKLTLAFGSPFGNYQANGIALLPSGKILVSGMYGSVTYSPFLARLEPNGTLDPSFGNGGIIDDIFPGLGDEKYWDCRRQSDNKIVAVGNYQGDYLVTRHLPDGTLDPTFGTNGYSIVDIDNGTDWAYDVKFDSEQRIILVGSASTNGSVVPNRMALVRFMPGVVGMVEFSKHETMVNIYPNPIQTSATLSYTLAESEELTLALHDTQGRVLTTYLSGKEMPAGEHTQTITMPADLASGNYLLVFSSPKGKMSVQVTKQ